MMLFPEDPKTVEKTPIKDGELLLYPHLFSPQESDDFLARLKDTVDWKQEEIRFVWEINSLASVNRVVRRCRKNLYVFGHHCPTRTVDLDTTRSQESS